MTISSLLRRLSHGFSKPSRRKTRSRLESSVSSEVLELRQLLTAQVTQMGDLNAVVESVGSDPEELTAIGSTVFFTAQDKTHGRELWKKEGTSAAVLVKDVLPGSVSSSITELTAVGTTLFFAADDGVHGKELWKSDGTAAGTVMVKDTLGDAAQATTSNFSGYPSQLTAFGGKLYYAASRSAASPSGELMSSDGTAAGTGFVASHTLVVDTTIEMAAAGGNLYFKAWSSVDSAGTELWKTDGTSAGTALVSDIYAGGGSSNPASLTPVGSTLYFTAAGSDNAGREVWKTDGTGAGTVRVTDFNGTGDSEANYLVNLNGSLYFSAYDSASGRELWKTDGTGAGTVLVKDIVAGTGSSTPDNLFAMGSTLYFRASDGVAGQELWKSNGTAAGTSMVGHSGTSANFQPSNLTNVNGSLYFRAFTFESGYEVWKSDGTAAGTNVFKDLVPGAGTSQPTKLLNANGTLFYTATDGSKGTELWRHDVGTNTATQDDIYRGTVNSGARNFTNVNGTIFFVADNGTNGAELWKSAANGTGATMVKDIYPGANGSDISGLVNVNGKLYFSARNDTNGVELWKSDGTAAGTVMLKDIAVGNTSSYPSGMINMNGTLIFSASDSNGHELWKSDGTAAGTVLVKDIAPGATGSILNQYNRFVISGSSVFFTADDGVSGVELWKTDGTTAGTMLVKDMWAGSNWGASWGNASKLTDVGGLLYFVGNDGVNGEELWQSDGTTAGTTMVADLNASGIDLLTNVNGKLFYRANGELWSRNSSSVTPSMVKELGEGGWEGAPESLTAVGSTLYFTAVYSWANPAPKTALGRELWKSDGTAAGTVLVKDIVNIPLSTYNDYAWGSNPINLVNNNGMLFFSANDGINGQELWISDGTTAGTTLFTDLTGDAGSSDPQNITAIDGRLYLTAMSEAKGREPLMAIDLFTPAAPTITAPTGTTASQRPTFTWTASNGAVSYDVFIKNNATGANPQVNVNVTGTSWVPTSDLGIGKFTVWVRAVSSSGTKSAWSVQKDFTINTAASLATMIRNQTTSRPQVVWKDLPGAVKYDVWLDSTTPGQVSTVILHNITGKSWQNATDLALGSYRVWVRGLDASGLAAAWSSVVFFNVGTPPTMTAPGASTFEHRPQFSWNAVPSATKYDLYIRNVDTETVAFSQANITATNWTPPSDLPDGHYRWQVVAASANARGLWSNLVDLTIGGQPELLTPTGSGTNNKPTFSWKPVAGAATYQLWVDRADTYVQGIINLSGLTGTSYTPATALPVGTFRVWVRAISATGELSQWSQSLTFSITT
ncbi:MAG: ELWxxDGT repeat protein [Planctomycetaceae bacterium]